MIHTLQRSTVSLPDSNDATRILPIINPLIHQHTNPVISLAPWLSNPVSLTKF
jgi:hypothetical protein